MGSKIIPMHPVHGSNALQRKPVAVAGGTILPQTAPKPGPGVKAPAAALIQRKTTQTAFPDAALPGRTLPAVPAVFAPALSALQMKQAPARQAQRTAIPALPPAPASFVQAAALAPRPPVGGALPVQCSRAATKAEKGAAKQLKNNFTLTYDNLDENSFLYAVRATGPVAAAPANTEAQLTIKTFLSQDLGDAKEIRVRINDVLKNPGKYRNQDSESSIHNNLEGRLPMYKARKVQPNLEYLAGGSGRIVVDVESGNVYFSHHYGDDTIKAAKDTKHPKHVASAAIVKAMGTTSAHVLLDPATWALDTIIADARSWWDEFAHTLDQ
jgi:hypothetical protein